MVTLLLLLILAWHFYIGYSRGIVLQAYYLLATIVSLVIASHNYQQLADMISLWVPYSNPLEGSSVSFFQSVDLFDLSQVFYAGVAFYAIYVVVYALFRLIGIFVHFAKIERFDKLSFRLIAGIMSLLVGISFLSFFFNILATVPLPAVQSQLSASWLIKALIHFPVLSTLVNQLWVDAVLK